MQTTVPVQRVDDARIGLVVLWVLFCTLLAIGGAAESAIAQSDAFQNARSAYTNLDLDAARTGFKTVLNDSSSPAKDRAEAARRLAVIAWRFDEDFSEAHTYIDVAEKLGEDPFETALGRARLLLNEERFEEARRAGQNAGELAEIREDTIAAAVTMQAAVLAQASRAIRSAFEMGRLRDDIAAALAALIPIIERESGHLELSRLALGLALLGDDGATALAAWRSYFWVSEDGTGNELIAAPHRTLSRILPGWRGPHASTDQRETLVSALAASGFYEFAAWLIMDPRVGADLRIDDEPAFKEILAFQQYRDAVRSVTESSYRKFAQGHKDTSPLRKGLHEEAKILWAQLAWFDQAPRYSDTGFKKEISERFNTLLKLESHYDFLCVHMGQRVVDEQRTVEQYGRRAEVRFVALDQIVSNGYDTWFWDGAAATGGWVDDSTIYQIRPAYTGGPLRAWSSVSDESQRRRLKEDIAVEAERDHTIARENPYAYMPGMALRMRLQANENLYAALKAKGLRGGALRIAFIAEVERQSQQSSIYAHEGRHVLERRNVPRNWFRRGSEKEFLAKLSEVALADNPRRAITGGILSADIGGDSSHGQANERIMKGLVKWMRAHKDEIHGFDDTRFCLPQLDLLTNEQLKAAFREMDPWAH